VQSAERAAPKTGDTGTVSLHANLTAVAAADLLDPQLN
jgi:hypothetical protein